KCNLSVVDKQQFIDDLKRDDNIRNVDDLKREIFRLDNESKMLVQMLRDETSKRNNFENIITSLKEKEKKLRTIEDKINLDTALINSAKVDIERLKESLVSVAEMTIAELREKFNLLEREHSEMSYNLENEQKGFDLLEKIIIQKETKVSAIETESIPEIEKKIVEKKHLKSLMRKKKTVSLEKELKDKNKEFSEMQKVLQTNIAQTDEIQKSLTEMKSVGASCPICDNKLTALKKKSIIDNKKKKIDKLIKYKKSFEVTLNKLENRIKIITEDISSMAHVKAKLEMFEGIEKEHQFLKDALKQLKDELKLHDNERMMLEKTMSVAKKRVEELRTEKDKLKSLFDKRMLVEDKMQMIHDLERQIEVFIKEKSNYSPISVSRIETMETELKSVIAKQGELKANLENMGLLVAEKRKRLSEIEIKLNMLDNYSSDIRRIEAISDQMRLLETSLISTQEQLRKNFVSTVNQAMQTLWSDIYPYEDIYDIRLAIENGDYVLQLQDSSGWMNADGSASGGERAIACLALRIAFALVLAPQLRWLVLDEPTANLDSKAVEDLASVLRDKVGEFVDQIFLITHDTALETAVSGYLYKIDREKQKDGYTRIAQVIRPE
ncbi:MAG: hypothetical protein GOV02_04140, partial [Candidatus Aenigmarchaeota archaeon]|nr:hypothetical protein [Candidatus Aenigmarchaeota archaeon]